MPLLGQRVEDPSDGIGLLEQAGQLCSRGSGCCDVDAATGGLPQPGFAPQQGGTIQPGMNNQPGQPGVAPQPGTTMQPGQTGVPGQPQPGSEIRRRVRVIGAPQ